jgi:sensor domain CHASE-containing protein
MNVRTKMISLLALLFAVLIVIEVGIQQRIVMPGFAELERDDARTSMKRVDYALKMTLDSLSLTAADWGNWADVYHFVRSPNAEFVDANVTRVAMKQLQINGLMIIDRDGRLILAIARDLESGNSLNLGFTTGAMLPVDFPWRRDLAGGQPTQGLLKTPQGIMMVAASPILDGSGAGQSRGLVIVGRLMTPAQLRMLGAQAQVGLSMTPYRSSTGDDRLIETETETQVFRPFFDIYGKPLMSLRVEVPRKITERGQAAVTYASTYLIGAGVLALILLVTVLNRIVVAPLARVTRHAVRIGEGTDLTARLDLPAHDEVGVLAREFDRMVERVAESRRQLVDQSFQAGFAELAKGVLHNLGNAMTPLGVRLGKFSERLRDAPVTEVEFAAAELAREAADSPRHTDLVEFLRLGCGQLAGVVKEAQSDVLVIQRQTHVVQTALIELMRSTRKEHVVESVRLPDLVTQTLEIVPDAARQRLVVEADDSLRRVGVVQVARTVLRLVLQNLIINAADAVRDPSREKGVLRVAAEIIRGADRQELHLQCEDNGVGISKDNLERVFEHGFSTKPRDSNYGVGLHWCANAVASLGGRIWASSDGPGRGASLHLLLPLTIPTSSTPS